MNATHTQPDDLLPAVMRRPGILWWLWLLPQTLLLALNLHNFLLVCSEMSPPQITRAGYLGAAQLALLAFGLATLLVLRLRNRPVPALLALPLFAAHAAYLWCVTASLADLLPRSVTGWILPEARFLYEQFALINPILFYAMLRLACFPVIRSRGADAAGSAIIAATGAVLIVLLPRFRWLDGETWIAVAAIVFAGALVLILLLRLLVHLDAWLASRGATGRALLALLVGIAGPIGGLCLNRTIPFPADFQSPWIYAFAIANGLLLALPDPRTRSRHLALWLLQAALFPFTCYFFIIFLPFILLALPAIIAAGAGFLILTPTALFIVHGRRLLEGLRLARVLWRPRHAALALAAALALLPLVLATTALIDRAGLRQAIAYTFEPAYTQATFPGSPALVRRTLSRMLAARNGRRLPILSAAYNRIVFGGLVLPDAKLRTMQHVFCGGLLPQSAPTGVLDDLFGRARPSLMEDILDAPVRPANFSGPAASLTDIAMRSEPIPGGTRSLLTLTLTNPHDARSEFRAPLQIPDGLLVSGLWLYMDNTRVPGQLIEKKTALWVYRMITGERRDPALLLFTSPGTADLRVFPFAPHEVRTVEIELLHPALPVPPLTIGNRTLALPTAATSTGLTLTRHDNTTGTLMIPAASLPTLTRQPYLHLIVDQSTAATASPPTAARVAAATARFPTNLDVVVTLANYEFAEPAGLKPRPLPEVLAVLDQSPTPLPLRGGFCRDRAIQRALTLRTHHLDDPNTPDRARLQAPIVVVIQDAPTIADSAESLAWFADLAPDFPFFYRVQGESTPLFSFLNTREPIAPREPTLDPVALLWCGPQFAALAPATTLLHLDRLGADPHPALRVYDPPTHRFHTEPAPPLPDGPYRDGLAAWALHQQLLHDPSQSPTRWPQVVRASQDCSVLTPATAWIVVESDAQRTMLARKEQQRLRHSESLDLAAVPEPGTYALMLLGAAVLAIRSWDRRRQRVTP